jgi:hypothetical protein
MPPVRLQRPAAGKYLSLDWFTAIGPARPYGFHRPWRPGKRSERSNSMILHSKVNLDDTRRPKPEHMLPVLRKAAEVAA